jgi:GNAT superfamily N-acetyltransferase
MPPSIYLSAMTLAPARTAPEVVREIEALALRDSGAPISLWDTFAELDLGALGFVRLPWVGELWTKDAATQTSEPRLLDLEIERVTDVAALEEFGIATVLGFESSDEIRAAGPLGMHAPATLDDPHMHYFVGRVGGRVATSAIAYQGPDVVGLYGISTLPEYRRRGYGKAITWAAANTAPALDVCVAPDPMARGIERELGFRKLAEFAPWLRGPS